MSGAEKAELLTRVASSGLMKRKVLGELGVPPELSTVPIGQDGGYST